MKKEENGFQNPMVTFLKSKIHGATITESNLEYIGSLTVDVALLNAANLYPYEKVQVVNINNGARFETYLIEGAKDSGVICFNGACARLGEVGDKIIIMSYTDFPVELINSHTPKLLFVDEVNRVKDQVLEV